MRVRRTTSSFLRAAALSTIAAVALTLGIVAVPVAASAVAPIVIDDFSGTVTGTRNVSTTSPISDGFTESGGVGIVKVQSPNGGSVTGTTLAYTFGTPLDLTSNGNNAEFMIGIESVTRTGNAPEWENAVAASISVTDANHTTGTYSTGYQAVTNFNQVMNFSCAGGLSACFTPLPDFSRVSSITVSFFSPRNLSPDVTTIRLTEIRTTPAGGGQPTAPTVTFAPVGATNPRWIEGSGQLSWDVSFLSDGQAATLPTPPTAGSFLTQTTGTVTTGNASLQGIGNGRYRYTTTVAGEGGIRLVAPAGIAVDNWGQASTAAISDSVSLAQGTAPVMSAVTATAVVGVEFSQQLIAAGKPSPIFAVTSGQLPSGLTLTSGGIIQGTPTAAGSFTATVKATNALGTASAEVTVTVSAIGFVSSPSVELRVGGTADFTVRWVGPPNTNVLVGGAFPDGVTVTSGANSLHLGGTPTKAGRVTLTLTLPGDVTQTLTIDVFDTPVVTGSATLAGVVGQPVSSTYTVTGWPAAILGIVGTLPPGVSTRMEDAALVIEGAPTQAGQFPFEVRASNSLGESRFAVNADIGTVPTISSLVAITNAPVGQRTPISIGSTGSPAPTISARMPNGDPLPAWISLAPGPSGTPQLVAAPDAPGAPVSIAVIATNRWGSMSVTTVVRPFVGPAISGPTEITSRVNEPLTPVTLTVTGDPAPTPNVDVTVTGDLRGLQVTQQAGEVTFSGTPDTPGSSTVTVSATALGVTVTHEVALTTTQAPTIDAGSDIRVDLNDEVDRKIEISGYPAPTVTAAGAPEGLSIVTDVNGTWLRGRVTSPGSHVVTLQAANSVANASTELTVVVEASPQIISSNVALFPVGTTRSFTVRAAGYPVPSLRVVGALPPGLTFVDNGDGTGTLAGQATSSGAATVTVEASNRTSAVQLLQIISTELPRVAMEEAYDLPVGVPVAISIGVSGYPRSTLGVSGLPHGLQLSSVGEGAFLITGTPTATGLFDLGVTATNSVGSGVANARLTIGSAPVITAAAAPRYRVDQPLTIDIATSGFPAPTLTSSALPDGLSLVRVSDALWQISGTPTVVGDVSITITAENGFTPAGSTAVEFTVDAVPRFTSRDAATFALGASDTFTVTTTGYPNATLTASTLPDGLSFWPSPDGSALITGSPTQSGAFPVTLTAANGTEDVTQDLVITVTEPATITGPADAGFRAGVESAITITATGFPVPELRAIGVADGLTFTDNRDGTATLSGTALSGGASALTVTATNVRGSVNRTIPVTITELPRITSPDSATVGVDFRQPITVSGFPLPTVSADDLPGGVTLISDADGFALVGSGAASGVHSLTLHADADLDGTPESAAQQFTLTVQEAPAITSGSRIDTRVGEGISFPVTTSGFPAPALTVSGLPDGVDFVDNRDGTGTISGASSDGGEFTVAVTAQNVRGTTTSEVTIAVVETPSFTSADTATTGAEFTVPVAVDGFPAPEVSADGLPDGVTLTDVDGAFALVGAGVTGGSYAITLHASNAAGSADQEFTLIVEEAPAFTSDDALVVRRGEDVRFTVTTSGFPLAAVSAAGLPAGLALTDNNDGTATINGSPTTAGASTATITAATPLGSVLQLLRVTVTSPTAFVSAPAADFREGEAGSFVIRTEGFPLASLAIDGMLPSGLAFTDAGDGTATIAGTPASAGTYTVTITATPAGVAARGTELIAWAARSSGVTASEADTSQQTLVITVAKRNVTAGIPVVPGPATTGATLPRTGGGEPSWMALGFLVLLAGAVLVAIARRRSRRG